MRSRSAQTVLTGAAVAPAQASETVVVCQEAVAVPVVAAGCAAVGVIIEELLLADRPFGPNGELLKIVGSPLTILDGNIKAARRESGELAKGLRVGTGISVRDIERHGIFGGPNSFFRKPFG